MFHYDKLDSGTNSSLKSNITSSPLFNDSLTLSSVVFFLGALPPPPPEELELLDPELLEPDFFF